MAEYSMTRWGEFMKQVSIFCSSKYSGSSRDGKNEEKRFQKKGVELS